MPGALCNIRFVPGGKMPENSGERANTSRDRTCRKSPEVHLEKLFDQERPMAANGSEQALNVCGATYKKKPQKRNYPNQILRS